MSRGVRYRRARHLVSWWTDEGIVTCNYALGTAVLNTPIVSQALMACTDWVAAADLRRRMRVAVGPGTTELIRLMIENGLLLRSDQPEDPRLAAADGWGRWNPAAGFFHQITKNVPGPSDRVARERELVEKYENEGAPPKVKRYPKTQAIPLPAPEESGEFHDVLTARRTWRWFADEQLPLDKLAALLRLTSGVQRVVETAGLGTAFLKTSPSSGARQPLEAYVLAVRVDGLDPGLYHYVADEHCLERIKRGATPKTIAQYLPGQPWYEAAGALLMLTAVFARTQWRYPFARAYRSVLLEAGHVCQTWCLVATWLGLAPFCTGRFADAVVERAMRIDGVTESFIYGGGVGCRPPGVDWAPWPPAFGNE